MNQWRIHESLAEEVRTEGASGYIVGFSAIHASGQEVWGSSFSPRKDDAIAKAKAELAERMVVATQTPAPSAEAGSVFARSNGWAAHPSAERARQAAFLELLERHRVLYFWYSGTIPQQIPGRLLSSAGVPEQLRQRISLYRFPANDSHEVCMAVVQPAPSSGPRFVIQGFAASPSLEQAAAKATREALQRWIFLYDENPDPNGRDLPPSALYQQEFGISAEGQKLFQDWMKGNFPRSCPPFSLSLDENRASYAQFHTQLENESLHVFQCKHPNAIPLVFGPKPKALLSWIPDHSSRWIQPIA